MDATQESKIRLILTDYFKAGITYAIDPLNEAIEAMYQSFTDLCMENYASYPKDAESYKCDGLEHIHQLNLLKKFICELYDAHVGCQH